MSYYFIRFYSIFFVNLRSSVENYRWLSMTIDKRMISNDIVAFSSLSKRKVTIIDYQRLSINEWYRTISSLFPHELREKVTIDDYQWLSMTIDDYRWLSMTIDDYRWLSINEWYRTISSLFHHGLKEKWLKADSIIDDNEHWTTNNCAQAQEECSTCAQQQLCSTSTVFNFNVYF